MRFFYPRGLWRSMQPNDPHETVAIVSETTTRELWRGAEALGQALRAGRVNPLAALRQD